MTAVATDALRKLRTDMTLIPTQPTRPELVEFLDLKDAIHIGHSTGGGVVARYTAKYGQGRVAKAVLISAVTPLMVQNDSNPDGVPMAIFDDIRENTATRRQQYFHEFTIPFYGYNRPGATELPGVRNNWWRQGMMGGINAQLLRHQSLLGNRLYGRPEKYNSTRTGAARRRRSDCAD